MAYHIIFVCFYGYQKMLRYGTFLNKCSQRFIDLIDVITSKEKGTDNGLAGKNSASSSISD